MKSLYEKMDARGVQSLSDLELLSLVLGDEPTAREEQRRLRMVGGWGLQRARQVQVAIELGRRVAEQQGETATIITSSDDVVRMMRPQLDKLPYEECWAIYLTNSNRLLEQQRISQGGVQGPVVDHRLVVKRALELLATRLILVHNHPSGAAEPSGADKQLTRQLKEAAALFDIRLLDHLIVAREGEFSFRRAGLL